jgi:hypothetical protein
MAASIFEKVETVITPGSVVAFRAMTRQQATSCDGSQPVTPCSFGYLGHVKWFGLKQTVAASVEAAICRRHCFRNAAALCLEWYILQITFTSQQALDLFDAGTLVRDIPMNGWRVYGKLDLASFECCWFTFTTCPMGMQGWADLVLQRSMKSRLGTCDGCTGDTTIYGGTYCQHCWHKYYVEEADHLAASCSSGDSTTRRHSHDADLHLLPTTPWSSENK